MIFMLDDISEEIEIIEEEIKLLQGQEEIKTVMLKRLKELRDIRKEYL